MHLFEKKHAEMKRVSRNSAAVPLLAECNYYATLGPDAEKLLKVFPRARAVVLLEGDFEDYREAQVPTALMPEAVNALLKAGHPVAILDRFQSDTKTHAREVLVFLITPQPKVEQDFC